MLRPGVLSVAAGSLLGLAACRNDDVVDPPACTLPQLRAVQARANEDNVLSAFVFSETDNADSVRISFGTNSVLDRVTPGFKVEHDTVTSTLFELLPSTSYSLSVVAYNSCGSVESERASLVTGQLPADLPKYSASGDNPAPGYVVFAAGNYGIVVNNAGRVVWYHRFANGPGLNFEAQQNGRYAARPPSDPGTAGAWVEIDPVGVVTRTLTCAKGLSARVHDLIALADGSYWLLCDETRAVDLSSQGKSNARVTATSVQHLSASGEILFDWSPFDHFDIDLSVLQPADLTGAAINWTHGNSIDLDSAGNLLVSFRNLSEITKIDTKTGAVLWRLGGARNEFAFDNVVGSPFSRQHGARAAGNLGVLLLDNLGEPAFSRAERYDVDPVRHIAHMSSSYGYAAGLVAQIGGSTQAVSAHTLVSFGNGAGVVEYDAGGNVVWKLDGNPGYVFRAQRIRSLYHPGVGDPR
jgi:hypothetical protein